MYAIVLKYQMGRNASRTRTLSDTLMWFFWVNGRLIGKYLGDLRKLNHVIVLKAGFEPQL